MPSSTSSSEPRSKNTLLPEPPQQAARAAEPVWERPVPGVGAALLVALVVFLLAMLGWETYLRQVQQVEPSYRNSSGLWAEQRRRINRGEGDGWVLAGSSRTLFDIQLHEWEAITGERPIQLALEGTSAMPVVENLADDEDFTGKLLVGVAPGLFFTGFAYRQTVIDHYRDQTPSQWLGHRISKLFEPWLAFYTPDYALPTILKRQDWPVRPGTRPTLEVRKLANSGPDRNTRLWSRVENDPEYQELAKQIWAQRGYIDEAPPPVRENIFKNRPEQIERAVAAFEKLRERGVEVVFVTLPYEGFYARNEEAIAPRAEFWEEELERTGAPGLHFQDHPEMQGYELPEWSHMSASEADRFTRAFVPLLLETTRAAYGDGDSPE